MASMADRVDQFRKMAEADPNNELGHFSLGRALMDANEFVEAAVAFERAIALNKNLSKAYQLLAMAQLKAGEKDKAVSTLQAGARIADERGDVMPRNDMIRMLKDAGAEVPELRAAPTVTVAAGAGEVTCGRCGLVKRALARPPFPNAQGQEIYQKICQDCWKEWIGMGTKVINELRLPLADPQAQKVYDQHMMEFLNLRA